MSNTSIYLLFIYRLSNSSLLFYPDNENTRRIMETVEVSAKYVIAIVNAAFVR